MKNLFLQTRSFWSVTMCLLLLTFCLIGCEKEQITFEDPTVINAKNWFQLNKVENNFELLNYVNYIDWKNAKSFTDESTKVLEIPLILEENIRLNSDKDFTLYNRLIIKEVIETGKLSSFIVNIFVRNSKLNDIDDLNYFNIPVDFSGKIIIMNTNSRSIYLNTIFNGESKNKDLIAKAPAVCYEIIELFDTGPPRPTGIKFCDTSGNVENLSTSSPNYPQHGGNRGGSSTSSTDNYKIIANLTGKAKCVYDKMVNSKGNINWILENFKDKNGKPSEFNLVLQMSTTLGNETNASTATPKQSGIYNTFVISINSKTLSGRTSLGLARTIIHEGIHARLWEFAYRNGKTISSNDFPGVYEYMRIYGENWDHQQMAGHYRQTIAKGLKQYDNAKRSDTFYDALAWEGLSEIKDKNGNNSKIYTEAWKKVSSSQQKSILQIIKNEKSNGSKNCN